MKIRVDFFKTTGKWYTTEEFELAAWPLGHVQFGFESFLRQQLTTEVEGKSRVRYSGMTAVCLDWTGVPHLAVVPTLETRCQACRFEAEWGTEECPHPVDARIHTCRPLVDVALNPDKPDTMDVTVKLPHEMLFDAARTLKAKAMTKELLSPDNEAPCARCHHPYGLHNTDGKSCSECDDFYPVADARACTGFTAKLRTCNRHKDCDAADARVKAKYEAASAHEKAHLPLWADHCDDETCEDCFGT